MKEMLIIMVWLNEMDYLPVDDMVIENDKGAISCIDIPTFSGID